MNLAETKETLSDESSVVNEPERLPEVLDILIVGGGPTGTAAAFRAKELGLSALVIDYDDLMKRIRDYAKKKPILPSFGGGDAMKFPAGGRLISELHFDPIDKDEMCEKWKGLYQEYQVPARIGVELVSLEADEQGLWRARTWNHSAEAEEFFVSRQVVLAFGRGVPRRFDIPGNVEGMAFRLADPNLNVGAPGCVIGGGTSSAEAVIAISNAKKKAGDKTAIYWSYRGESMPKVSKALADVFFQAYVVNGNIRYLPNSEPIAVVTGEEDSDYLCIRTDRKVMPDRPTETTQLEFLKQYCIACIGEDIPEPLLNSMGIYLMSGGPRNRKRLVVSPLLETCRSNLYLAGDILSPAYLETQDFDGDPSTFPEIKRRGNVKSALRDGVFVTEVIAQKLAGQTSIHVQMDFTDRKDRKAKQDDEESRPADREAAASADAEAVRQKPTEEGLERPARLLRILQGEITADEYDLRQNQVTTIGKRGCDISFEEDSALSDKHASILHQSEGYFLHDEGGRNGVFLQLTEGKSVEAPRGAIVKAGEQWLVFGDQEDPATVVHYDREGREVKRLQVTEKTTVLGRQTADINLDPSDASLSRRHLSVSLKNGRPYLRDLRSTNGTLLKANGGTKLDDGDRIWLGNQVLQFISKNEATPGGEVHFDVSGSTLPVQNVVAAPPVSRSDSEEIPPPASVAAASGGDLCVTFENVGKTVPLRKGQTICEIAEEHGIQITAQCHQGICGSDPIRIVSGHDHLNPMGEGEEDTLDEICSVEEGQHRLACMARPTGPVVVEIVGKN